MRFSKASNLAVVGTLNQSETGKVRVGGACAMHMWGVHMQCACGGCTHNVCVGVHTQCTHGGCTHNVWVGECMRNVWVGGADAMHTWGVHMQCACGGTCAMHAWGVHVQCAHGIVTPIN